MITTKRNNKKKTLKIITRQAITVKTNKKNERKNKMMIPANHQKKKTYKL